MPAQFPSTRETDESIAKLLVAVAFPDDKFSPLTVITNDFRLWVSQFPRQQMTVLDISLLAPPQSGRVQLLESEVEREVMRNLLSGGWPAERVIQQYRPSAGARADFGLLGRDGKLVAVVEAQAGSKFHVSMSLDQAKRIAQLAGVRYAIVTNGAEILMHDSQGDVAIGRSSLPTPDELTTETRPVDVHELASANSPLAVRTLFDFPELLESIWASKDCALIIDHTIPWGSRIPDLLSTQLPEGLGNAGRLDMPAAFMGVAAGRTPPGTVVGISPPSFCFASTFGRLRQYVSERLHLDAVIELPPDLFRPYTSVKSVIVKLAAKGVETPQRTYFFSLASPNELAAINTQNWFADLKNDLRSKGGKLGFRTEVAEGEPWTVAAHRPATRGIEGRIAKYGKSSLLGDLCDVLPGFRHLREEAAKGKGIPIVRGRDITAGIDSMEQLTHYKTSGNPPEHLKIRAGDLLIQRIGANPACMVAPSGLVGAIASDTVFILRPKSEEADPYLISQFLSSSDGQDLLAERLAGVGAPTLSISTLRSVQVPVLGETVAKDLQELSQVEQALRVKAEKLRALRLTVFSADSSSGLQSRLREIRQVSKSVAAGIEQSESFPFQIRNLYPYPLAYPYRLLVGINNPSELYSQQLRVAENILAFLASICLALVDKRDRAGCAVDLAACWRGGISPGDWREICQKAVRVLKNYKDHRLAQSLSALWADTGKKGFFQRVDTLIRLKNDMKHDRGPKNEDEFVEATCTLGEVLTECLRDMAFMTEHPIRLVRDMDVARGTRTVVIYTLRCEGDHPGFPQEKADYPEPLKKNDLYIEVEPARWVALFPFVVPRNCPQCKSREIYFVDKWQGKGEPALLKSFERGHSVENDEVGQGLEAWQNGA
ncbi:MAG: hypothetical protein ACE145_09675 [Terriglobia bacterium]